MDMPKVNEHHRKLEQLVGDWSGEEKLSPSPWDPKGGTAIGRSHNRTSLGGFIVIHDYEQERGGQVTFSGHGVFSWNAIENCFEMLWFDSMGLPPNVFRGQFEGSVMKLDSHDAKMQSRVVFDFSKTGFYTFRMDVSPDGTQWHNFMEGTYAKGK